VTGGYGPAPLEGVDVLLADLDGVVYASHTAIPHAVEALNGAAASGHRVGYLTNNASRTPQTVAAQLCELGLHTEPDDIVSSPQAAVVLLAELVPRGATVLVVGGEGLTTEVERAGFRVTRSADDAPAAVVQGFAPHVAWTDLAEAAFALKGGDAGIPWVATNTDWTIPQARGTAPGNGTLVSAVHTAVGRLPVVAGKPERGLFDVAMGRFSAQNPLFIGDRLDTDILGARRAGMPSVLVLTGIDGPQQLLAAAADSRPDFVLEDLRGLTEPYPVTEDVRDIAGVRRVRVGTAVVRQEAERLTLDEPGTGIDRVRAAAAAVWGAGMPIYALEVAPELYS